MVRKVGDADERVAQQIEELAMGVVGLGKRDQFPTDWVIGIPNALRAIFAYSFFCVRSRGYLFYNRLLHCSVWPRGNTRMGEGYRFIYGPTASHSSDAQAIPWFCVF